MRDWSPPPALGPVPEALNDPAVRMLWGVTQERIQAWLSPAADQVRGFGASSGVVEGPARVLTGVNQIGEIRDGETARFRLVLRRTPDGWTQSGVSLAAPVPAVTAGLPEAAAGPAAAAGPEAAAGPAEATAAVPEATTSMDHRCGYSDTDGPSVRLGLGV